MKIAIVTDAWRPQTNGVVTTLTRTADCLRSLGHEVVAMTPDGFRTVPCPTYPEIRLALFQGRRVADWLAREQPEALHIATEGPLGLAARNSALRMGLRFTTSYHTQFPQYVRARYPIPERVSYAVLRRFHAAAERTMVGTPRVRADLRAQGFRNLVLWTRGVDTTLFRPRARGASPYAAPVLMYVGRVAVEKSVEDFLRADVPGTKVVVGGGPALQDLRARYPAVVFTGYRYGEELAELLASADAFVFPSRTDTFGLVMLEALASGVPVAAFPVAGPIDVIEEGVTGCLRDDLAAAIRGALALDRDVCRERALSFSWEHATREFLGNLVDAQVRSSARATGRARLAPTPDELRR